MLKSAAGAGENAGKKPEWKKKPLTDAVYEKEILFDKYIYRHLLTHYKENIMEDNMNKSNHSFTLNNISSSRTLLMGIATLWVALSHCRHLDFSQSWLLQRLNLVVILSYIRNSGNAGVDIFLFLSGFGLFHSLASDPQIRPFYARRFWRILPSLFFVSVIYYGLTHIEQPVQYGLHIFQLSIYHPVYDRGIIWFFSLLIPLYLLYPLFHKVINRYGLPGALGLIVLSILFSFGVRAVHQEYFEKIEIMLMRVPIFIAGIAAARLLQRKAVFSVGTMITVCVCSLLYFFAIPLIPIPADIVGLERYLYFPLAIGFCLSLSFMDQMIPGNMLRRFLILVGSYSLEIYLLFEIIEKSLVTFYRHKEGVGIPYSLACFAITLVLAFMLRCCSETIVRNLKKSKTVKEKD